MRLTSGPWEIATTALVDTGCSSCVFARGVGEALQVDVDGWRTRENKTFRIAGADRIAVAEYVTLTLPPFHTMNWETQVWFFVEEWELPFGLLGNEGFFDRWAVTFNRYGNYFVVESVPDFEARMPADELAQLQGRSERYWGSY